MEDAGSFYVTAGTLAGTSACYVVRSADEEVINSLERGEFCFVLSSRQMGKSSLVVRTVAYLKTAGIVPAVIDLSSLGVNLTVDQWYHGLAEQVGRRLGLRGRITEYWRTHSDTGALQRWMGILSDVVLPSMDGRVVIFIDEVDIVQSLPFSTDEFFASIRACCNARAHDTEMSRLTFCIVGTATPTDLIEDPRLTPFNIGRRIPLNDFTLDEAAHLRYGLGQDSDAAMVWMSRIYYWADGHPCLTQRLCQSAAELIQAGSPVDIDAIVQRMFFQPNASKHEDNLIAVRDRLLGDSEKEASQLITLYKKILKGKADYEEDGSALTEKLKLTGAVKDRNGQIAVRNRIYARVFDSRWADAHLPGAERMRQRTAYRLGMLRAAVASSVIVAVVLGLAITAVLQARRANWFAQSAHAEAVKNGELLYASDMSVIDTAYHQNDYARMRSLLQETAASPIRGFEWYYWNREVHRDRLTLPGGNAPVNGVFYSPVIVRGALITYGSDGSVRVWDSHIGSLLRSLYNPWSVHSVGISPDGKILIASGANDQQIAMWDIGSNPAVKLPGPVIGWHAEMSEESTAANATIQVSLPKQRVGECTQRYSYHCDSMGPPRTGPIACNRRVTKEQNGDLVLWNLASNRRIAVLNGHKGMVCGVVFSPSGRLIATCGKDRTTKLWDSQTGNKLRTLVGHTDTVREMDFSPDSRLITTVGDDGIAIIWDAASGAHLKTLRGHEARITGVCFAPDGRSLATCSEDGTAKVWDLAEPDTHLRTFGSAVNNAFYAASDSSIVVGLDSGGAFILDAVTGSTTRVVATPGRAMKDSSLSRQGGKLATAYVAGTACVYDLSGHSPDRELKCSAMRLDAVAISAEGKFVVTGSHTGMAELYDAESGERINSLTGHSAVINSIAISPNGERIVTGSSDATIKIWDTATGRLVQTLTGHTDRVYSVAFSPDGKYLISGSRDQTADIWSMTSYQRLLRIVGHNAPIYSVGFSPDAKRVVTAGGAYIKLWDIQHGRLMLTLTPDTGNVNSASFASDGHKIVTATTAGSVQVWSAEPIPR